MVEEMKELRTMLTECGIEWHDASTPPKEIVHIDRTHFEYKNYSWSVVNGFGTKGGFYPFRNNENQGLLELMSNAVNGGEPVGYLTAEQCMELIILEGNK